MKTAPFPRASLHVGRRVKNFQTLAQAAVFGMGVAMDKETPSPLVPDLDLLKGPDHAPAIKGSAALTRSWQHETDGNALDFLPGGPERLTKLLAIINEARHSLRLLYYMFCDDASGRAVMAALMAALERGVSVSLIIDSFGSDQTPAAFFEPFRHAGGDYHVFSSKWRVTYLIRNHQKLLIADDRTLVIGGFNIADDYFAPVSDTEGWQDLGLQITGPAVAPMVDYYRKLNRWVSTRGNNWKSLRYLIHTWDRVDPERARKRFAYSSPSSQKGALHWYVGGPTRRLNPWAKAIKADMERGRQLDMIEAYFAPGQGMLRRIARMAKYGKGARIILPSKSDNGATIGAARILYGYLLKRGVKIAEFAPCQLHTKLIVIDSVTYIGSANFDMRSLFINMELMLRIDDASLAQEMRAFIGIHADYSDIITRKEHKRKLTPLNRLRWSLAYFIVAVMDYGVTRRLNFGIKG